MHYLRIAVAIDVAPTEDGEVTLHDFRKNYNIRHCIKNIDTLWRDMTETRVQDIWNKYLKDFVLMLKGLKEMPAWKQ